MRRMLPTPYLFGAIVLGILALLNIVWLRHNSISTAIAIALYLVVFTLAFFGGRSAKLSSSRPGLYGAMIGVLFGVIAGLGSFLVRDSLRDIDVPAHLAVRLKLLAWANSPGGHIAALVTAMVAFGVISLVVGSIGGVSVKGPTRPGKA
ncbi:MAG: hypothetical protein C7B45_04475 [Sulfobacillus acidophilus]|uniref:DUF4199 domain-containing protein n=1 Tax=Sulfobacillus acidophilus TaxID=53633 RepID=A0A2T2WLE3_9FIRM|nr:MAG: hypothetical protein C7B45_04475 [Sulfobacillus acidophilus]